MNSKPGRQLWLPLTVEGELGTCDLSAENPKPGEGLMERVLAPENLRPDASGCEQTRDLPLLQEVR